MSNSVYVIRALHKNDDFEEIRRLLEHTRKKYTNDDRMSVPSAEELKNDYFPTEPSRVEYGPKKGFISVKDGNPVAFMGISLNNATKNGFVEYGILENDEATLHSLIEKCCDVVTENGGNKIYYFAFTQFGQIRNPEITQFEKFGFISDEFSNCSTHLALNHWEEPQELDTSNIYADRNIDLTDIEEMLVEDGELSMAEQFKNSYSEQTPDVVILTLKNADNEMTGFAYYKVRLAHPSHTDPSANAFGIHFRPKYHLTLNEKRRLLHAALRSMKQLNAASVTTLMSLKNFETFVILANEGFTDFIVNSVRLTKPIH